ncbi:Uncharacterized protein QTN25_001792 [Entamoeba marina]
METTNEALILGKNHQLFLESLGFWEKIKGDKHVVFRNKEHIIIEIFLSPNTTTKNVLHTFYCDYIKNMKVRNMNMKEISELIPIKEIETNDEWYESLPNDRIERWWEIFDFAFNFDKKLI